MLEVAATIVNTLITKIIGRAFDIFPAKRPDLRQNVIRLHTALVRMIEQSIDVVAIIDSHEYEAYFYVDPRSGYRNQLIDDEMLELRKSYERFSDLTSRVFDLLNIYDEELSKQLCFEKDEKGDWIERVDALVEAVPIIHLPYLGAPLELAEMREVLNMERIANFVEQERNEYEKKGHRHYGNQLVLDVRLNINDLRQKYNISDERWADIANSGRTNIQCMENARKTLAEFIKNNFPIKSQ